MSRATLQFGFIGFEYGVGGGVRLTSLYDARLQDGAFNQSAPDIVIATCPDPSFSTGIGAGLGVGFPGRSSVVCCFGFGRAVGVRL